MRFWILSALFLSILVVQFEAKPFQTLRNVGSKKLDEEKLAKLGEEFKKFVKGKFEQISREDLSAFLIHLNKAFGDKESLEKWYSLEKSERQCIQQTQGDLFKKIFSGTKMTCEEALDFIKNACPESADAIQTIYDRQMELLKKLDKDILNFLGKLPESLEKAFKKLYNIFKEEKTGDQKNLEFLEFLECLLEVPEEDLQKFAELCPDMAPVLIGELKKPACVIIRALIKHMKTGEKILDEAFYRALGKFIPFIEEKFLKIIQMICDAPEQDLSDAINQGIEEEVNELVEKIYAMREKVPQLDEKVDFHDDDVEAEHDIVKRDCEPGCIGTCPDSCRTCCV